MSILAMAAGEQASPLAWLALKLLIVLAPLWAAANFQRTYPHRPLVYLAIAPALLSIVMAVLGSLELVSGTLVMWVLLPVDAVVLLLAVGDYFTLPGKTAFTAERQVQRVASLRKTHPVKLTLTNPSLQDYMIWVRDGAPHELNPRPDEFALHLGGRSRSTIEYEIRSTRRGAFQLSHVHLRVRSRLGFWQRYIDYPLASVIHVYPDLKQLAEYAVLARTNRLSLMGVRRTRKIGQDNEFERLRDHTLDDNFKHIDWRSTARRNKLTTKQFQANQSQRLIFLLDCGRMMTNEASGVSLLDHALNSMLMLSYVALSHGDSVGLVAFSDEVHGFVPPKSGPNQMNRLLHASFDRFPNLVESRYDQAFLYLASHCRKRSLVVLISNVIDEVNANQIERYLASLVGRHLPMSVLLRDHRIFDAADVVHPHDAALYRAAAAAEILSWRHQVISDMERKGVLSIDVFPEALTAPLVNRYLDVKARHLL